MLKYYELTDETINHNGVTLHRIRATHDIPLLNVAAGDLGGFVESTDNLRGAAWVADNAKVYGTAQILGDEGALVSDNAEVYDTAMVYGAAHVSGDAHVYDRAVIRDDACVNGNAHVSGTTVVRDSALAGGDAHVQGESEITDTAMVIGGATVVDSRVCGNSKVSGDVRGAVIFDEIVEN